MEIINTITFRTCLLSGEIFEKDIWVTSCGDICKLNEFTIISVQGNLNLFFHFLFKK